jgi:hypothetical protein
MLLRSSGGRESREAEALVEGMVVRRREVHVVCRDREETRRRHEAAGNLHQTSATTGSGDGGGKR